MCIHMLMMFLYVFTNNETHVYMPLYAPIHGNTRCPTKRFPKRSIAMKMQMIAIPKTIEQMEA